MPNVLNEFTGDGVTRTFNFAMTGGYLSRDYVYFFTRPNADLLNYTPYNDDDITWISDYTVRTAAPIPVGYTFVVVRSTPLDPLVDFQNTSRITEKNLDTATWQGIHIAAEASDTVGRIQVVAQDAKQESAQALANAQAAAASAATAAASAIAASTAASAAQVAALQAGSDAADAALSAATAAGVADTAALTANAANTTAIAAATDAAAAVVVAGNANSTANSAASQAGTAVNTANTAMSTANAASTASGDAVTTANSAAATANTALTIANEAKDLVDEAVSGAVVSFNGRAGAVTPQAGDYTKLMVGLGSVDNTPDLEKPISTATSNALGLKADTAYVNTQLATKADSASVTNALALKADSTSVSNALATKADTIAVNDALASNAAADRNRANHTGTQPVSTITGLGTAAVLDVATGPEDMTTSRLQRVGAFGIGSMFDFRSASVAVHGNLPPYRFFNVGTRFGMADGGESPNNSLRIPGLAPGTYGVLVIHGHYSDASASSAIQRWFFSGQRMWFSSAVNDSTWGGWVEVATQVNGSALLPMLGNYQTWQLVSRAPDVNYYNTSTRPIVLNVAANAVNATTEILVWVSGVQFRIAGESTTSSPRMAGNVIIPPGAAYQINVTSGATITNCHELR